MYPPCKHGSLKHLLLPFVLIIILLEILILSLNRDQSDKYYKSKYRDLKAKLRMTNDDLQAKQEK